MGVQSLLQKVYRYLFEIRNKYVISRTYKAEIRNIQNKEALWSKVELSDNQEKEIVEYWKEISGEDISTKWHRLYQSYMGIYNKQYFPEILFSTKLEEKLSPQKYYGILSDKGFLNTIFPGGGYRTPVTYLWNCDGVCTDENRKCVSKIEIEAKLANFGKVVIKPTRDTSSGEGVRILELEHSTDKKTLQPLSQILNEYGMNYVIQECVVQSKYMEKIYSGSLNTFRVITFITPDGIKVAPIGMRMGRGRAEVDNIHAGGLTIGITDQHTLREYAFSEMGEKYSLHPDSRLVFKGYSIPPLQKVIEQAKKLHAFLPQIKMISWDWAIDTEDMPVLIEINISGQSVWFPQMLNGESVFGEYTEYFANMIKD